MFVTFEGPEGAGKSRLIAGLADQMRKDGHDPLVTREPGAGPLGTEIRRLLLSGEDLAHKTELFLFLADRAHHVETLIQPALAESRWVLCDRYADSTYVYQAMARGLDIEFVSLANRFATGGLTPDITILLDLDVRVGLARLSDPDRLDQLPIEFHERVRAGYLELATQEPERWTVIDATQPPEDVLSQVLLKLRSASDWGII